MEIWEIKELIEILSDTDIAELCVESNGVKISIKKGAAFVQAPPSQAVAAAAPALSSRREDDESAVEDDAATELQGDGYVTVQAPMVGTFYRAPAPDADPYVNPGDSVQAGQPLCIIEAMKLMNEIESEVSGRVVKILVENGQPVEYGQPLFVIESE